MAADPGGHQLTFVNQPEQGKFRSHAITLLTPPPPEWLAESAPSHADLENPPSRSPPGSPSAFELISTMAERGLSEATQAELLRGFYAELRAANALGYFFPPAP